MYIITFWLAVVWAARTLALHSSEAGVVDWHKSLVGVPLTSALSTAPQFHRIGGADGPTHSVVLTATASNVLAALDPVNGSIVWRHIFEENERVIAYKQHADVVAAVSGSGGATLRLLDASEGHLLFEQQFHKPESGRLFEPETLGTAIAFDGEENDSDVFVLSNAHIIRRVDGKSGEVKWGWTSPDQASLVAYSKIVATPSTVYLIGLAKSFASFTVHVTALSTRTGELITSMNVPSSITNGLTDFFVLGSKYADIHPRVVWLEAGTVRWFTLTSELTEQPMMIKGAVYKSIVDVGLHEHGQFIALKESGAAQVLRSEEDVVRPIWEFVESASSKQYTDSVYTGGVDKEGFPYIARVYWSHVLQKASAHIFAAHLAEGKGLVTGFTFPFDTNLHGIITHVALDTANLDALKVLARLVITTSTGAVQLWQQDEHQWNREEGLTDIKVAELIELPEPKIATAHTNDKDETFFDRLVRQIRDAQDFPQYALNFARRFVTGSYASASSSVAAVANASEPLSRDAFGFRKVIVVATARGKIYGMDSANGDILWSRVLGLGWAAEVGGQVLPVKMFVTRTVSDGDTPQIALVTQRRASNSLVDTVLFHVDALTGQDARASGAKDSALLQGDDIIAGPLVESYILQAGSGKFVVLLDEFVQIHLYPDTTENKEAFSEILTSLHVPLRTGAPGRQQLTGHRVSPEPEFTGKYILQSLWTLSLPSSEYVQSIIPRPLQPVASLGKVLGNRTTLYKYLNSHLMAVVTGSSVTSNNGCSIYLIDGAKGTILYHVALPSTDGTCDVKVTLTENWLVYQYYDGELAGTGQAKSHRIVSVEFYEGSGVDDKIKSSDLSSLSNQSTAITAFEEAYVFPNGVSALSTTSTTYGITVRDIIVANENHQIQSIPRRFLDPRRPKRKPTNEELEEWLIQYDPLIPDDPKRMLSHNYQVVGVKHIVTSPALLESTSLVFAYGQDLFFTRVAPSNTFDVLNENFNKAQLVLTIAGLALAIVIAKPMVRRKRLKEKWYD